MRNDQYLKLEVSSLNADAVERMIDRLGMEGWGIYVALLLRMRQDDELTIACTEPSVAAMARRWNTTSERVTEVVRESGLFLPFDENGEKFSSPYLDRVMAALWIKRGQKPRSAANPQARTVNRSADGRFAVKRSIEEKSREREEKSYISSKSTGAADAAVTVHTVDAPVAAASHPPVAIVSDPDAGQLPPVPIRPWQLLVDEMVADRPWMELVGMRSGLGQLYIDHRAEIVELFRKHVRLYDKGGGLLRLQDVKQYFANYLTAGSRTCQGVREKLLDGIRQQQASTGVSPYETLVDGRRTYLGRVIPDDAPPRPDEFSVWDEDKGKWTR